MNFVVTKDTQEFNQDCESWRWPSWWRVQQVICQYILGLRSLTLCSVKLSRIFFFKKNVWMCIKILLGKWNYFNAIKFSLLLWREQYQLQTFSLAWLNESPLHFGDWERWTWCKDVITRLRIEKYLKTDKAGMHVCTSSIYYCLPSCFVLFISHTAN